MHVDGPTRSSARELISAILNAPGPRKKKSQLRSAIYFAFLNLHVVAIKNNANLIPQTIAEIPAFRVVRPSPRRSLGQVKDLDDGAACFLANCRLVNVACRTQRHNQDIRIVGRNGQGAAVMAPRVHSFDHHFLVGRRHGLGVVVVRPGRGGGAHVHCLAVGAESEPVVQLRHLDDGFARADASIGANRVCCKTLSGLEDEEVAFRVKDESARLGETRR